jgi:hypothetical protein
MVRARAKLMVRLFPIRTLRCRREGSLVSGLTLSLFRWRDQLKRR